MVVGLGPVMPTVNNIPKNPRSDGTGSNPRCLRRDINHKAAMGPTTDHAYKLFMRANIHDVYNTLLGTPPPEGDPYP
jgi:tyrosinase